MANMVTPLQSPGLTPAASPGMTPAASPLPGVTPREAAEHSSITPGLATPPSAYTPAASPLGRTPAASPEISPRGVMSGDLTAPGRPGQSSPSSPNMRRIPIANKSENHPQRSAPRRMQSVAEAWAKKKMKVSHRRQANNFRLKALDCISLEDMTQDVEDKSTRRDIFRRVIDKQRRNTNGCLSMPVNIIFFVVYAVAVRLHEDITNVWLLESSMRNMLLPDITQLETIEDVWDWLAVDFVNDFFVQTDFYGQALPPEEWSRVRLYSQIQGSVLLTQSRDTSEPWGKALSSSVLDSFTRELYEANAGFVPRSIAKTPSGRRLSLTLPSLKPALPSTSEDDATYDFALYPTEKQNQISADLDYLAQRGWLDQHTNMLSIKALLLNSELGPPRVEQVIVHLTFSRGGGVYADMSLQNLFLNSHSTLLSVGIDVVWVFMLCAKTLDDSKEVWDAFTLSTLNSHMFSGVTLLDWIIIVFGWANVGGFALQSTQLVHLTSSLENVIRISRDATGSGHATAEQRAAAAKLHEDADNLNRILELWRMILAWYTIILMFRFFVAFRSQPRLAVVTTTLKATFLDLVHFLVVFVPMLLAYAVSGNLLFGRRIEQFSSLQASVGVCLRVSFESEYQWLLLSEEHFTTSALWTWSYLVMVVLVMLNLVLAIVLDIYNSVRSNTNSHDTIFLSIRNVVHRLANSGKWVKDEDLQCVLNDMDDHSTLTLTDLCEALPNLTPVQQDMLFDACREEMAWQAKQDIRRNEFLKLAASIKLSIDQANMQLEDVQDEHHYAQNDMSLSPIKESSSIALRMQGNSRPFPGMPTTPGGYFPPILEPTKDAGIHVPPLDLEPDQMPVWYLEMKQALSTSCDLMMSIKYEVESLQWMWYQLNEVHRPKMLLPPELTELPGGRQTSK